MLVLGVDYLVMIRDYPQYGHDWEIMHGVSLNPSTSGGYFDPSQIGMGKRQLGLGIGPHPTAGSRITMILCI